MNAFGFSVPQQILFGMDKLSELPAIAKDCGASSVLLVSDKGLAAIGLVDAVERSLREAGLRVTAYTDVAPNPTIEHVEAATALYKHSGSAALVALGGGSPMDVAKAVAVVATYGGSIADYEGAHKVPGPIAPIVAIPTTAGTGSEVTAFSVITDTRRQYKLTVFSYNLLPKVALLDPRLIMTLPASIAASTGMDALIHAVEAYVSLFASPFSEAMSEKAIRLIGANIRHFVGNRGNAEAASAMLTGSMLAGIAFACARLGFVHAMSHPVSAHFNVPHGVANAVLFPTIMEHNALTDSGKYRFIHDCLHRPDTAKPPYHVSRLAEVLRQLNAELGIPSGLAAVGVDPARIPVMAKDAMLSGNIQANPRQGNQSDIEALYHQAM